MRAEYRFQHYAKAALVFTFTTASYFLARTIGILPSWLSDGSVSENTNALHPFQLLDTNSPRRVDTTLTSQSVFPDQPLTLSLDSSILFSNVNGSSLNLTLELINLTAPTLPQTTMVFQPPSTWEWTVFPTISTMGNYLANLTATDGDEMVWDSFPLRIEGPPQINGSIPHQYAKVGQPFNYFLPEGLVFDPNGDVIQFQANLFNGTDLPDGLAFNGISATFYWVPSSVGQYNVTVSATDNNPLSATDNIAGTVNISFLLSVDNNPVANSVMLQAVAGRGQPFVYTIPNNTFVDPDHDPLSYSVLGLPAGLSFDANTSRISGRLNQTSSYPVVVVADDGHQGFASARLTIIVADAPQVQQLILPQVADIGQLYHFEVPPQSFRDDGNVALSYTATTPDWLDFNPDILVFSGTPLESHRGQFSVQLQARNPLGLTTAQNFIMTVTHFPQLVQPLVDQVIAIGEPYEFRIPNGTFREVDNETISLQLLAQPDSSVPDWVRFNASLGRISGTPVGSTRSRYDWKIRASDPWEGYAESLFSVITNHRPEQIVNFSLPTAGAEQFYNWTIPPGSFGDFDGDALRYQVEHVNPSQSDWVQFDTSTLTFSGRPNASDLGDPNLLLTVSDGYLAINRSLVLRVRYIPQLVSPIPTLPSYTAGRAFNLTLNLSAIFHDQDDPLLTYKMIKADGRTLPEWLEFDSQSGMLFGMPTESQIGRTDLSIVASDPEGNFAEGGFHVNIETNYPPQINQPISNQIADVGQFFELSLPNNTFIDRNKDDILSYRALLAGNRALPSWLHFNVSQRRLWFYGRPGPDDTNPISDRKLPIKVYASDGVQEADVSFQITVTGVSQLEEFLKFGLPTLSAMLLLLRLYKKRAVIVNRCKTKCDPNPIQTEILEPGRPFEYKIPVPPDQVKNLQVQLPQSIASPSKWQACCGFFSLRSHPLPGGSKLPYWMKYNPENHRLLAKEVPLDWDQENLVLQIQGSDGVIVKETNLRISSQAQALVPQVEDVEISSIKTALSANTDSDVEMQRLSFG